tara:strand:- start:1136 stop:1339 length:204 start_codon:yes stop_codon:yes gene_type:complete
MVKNEVKNRVGRPRELNTKNSVITVRFTTDELKQIKVYLKKHKIESVSKLLRLAVKEKVTQTDLFLD